MHTLLRKLRLALGLLMVIASQQASAIVINLDFSDGGLSSSQQSVFYQAESFWENTLTGYQNGIGSIMLDTGFSLLETGVTIKASGVTDDGVGGTLGWAGPNTAWVTDDYWLSRTATMAFDSDDLYWLETRGLLESVILHEMAHALGFGTLWTHNNVYEEGSGRYTGAAGLAAYQAEFDPRAEFIPVGESDGHWEEQPNGIGLTGITDDYGNDMTYELMTPYLNTDSPSFMSNTTIQSFVDIGYTVSVVPAPAAIWMFILGLGLLFGVTRKRQVIS